MNINFILNTMFLLHFFFDIKKIYFSIISSIKLELFFYELFIYNFYLNVFIFMPVIFPQAYLILYCFL